MLAKDPSGFAGGRSVARAAPLLVAFWIGFKPAAACETFKPDGVFDVVAVRQASDVAATAPDAGAARWPPGDHATFAGRIAWITEETCDGPVLKRLDEPTINPGDPILSDTQVHYRANQDREGRPRNIGYVIECDGKAIGSFTLVDPVVLVAASPNGTSYAVLWRRLPESAIRTLQHTLEDRKFAPGPVDGRLGPRTLAALALYLEYLGVPYEFARPVANEAVLKDLDVTCAAIGGG